MLSISVNHPDAEKFVDAKLEEGKVTGANISVKCTDEFMRAVKHDSEFLQTFPINDESLSGKGYEFNHLYNHDGVYGKKINPKKLWDKVIKNAWKSAEPGILFWDTILNEATTKGYGKPWEPVSCNPCGEIPLNPYDSCRLLAINLYSYVKNPFTKEAEFDWDLFRSHVQIAQRIMDDIVDLEIEKVDKIIEKIESDPEDPKIKEVELNLWKKIKQRAIDGRRTGLGITAEGDMLAALGLRYGTPEATYHSVSVHRTMAIESYKSSIIMASERGAFPIWDFDKEIKDGVAVSPFVERVLRAIEEDEENIPFEDTIISKFMDTGRRNIANLTIAPTGTTSLMTQTTSGIEPVFLPTYKRRRKIEDKTKADFIDEMGDAWEEYNVFHHKFIDWFTINADKFIDGEYLLEVGWDNEATKNYLSSLSDEELNYTVKKSPYYKATSNDVDWKEKVKMQGEIQKWVDHSISVTINLPKYATEELVNELYLTAWESGCKGVTIYRDGSRAGVLISNDKKEELKEVYKRGKEVNCDINHLKINGIKWLVLVGVDNGRPVEIFALKNAELKRTYKTGKLVKIGSRKYDLHVDGDGVVHNITGEFENPSEGALTRMISLALKTTPVEDIYVQLQKEGGISDFNKVLSRTLKKYIKDQETDYKCPQEGCNGKLQFKDGCILCPDCGWSQCG